MVLNLKNPTKKVLKAITSIEKPEDKITFSELQKAVSYWFSGQTVPGTDEKIDFSMLQEIIRLWFTGKSV